MAAGELGATAEAVSTFLARYAKAATVNTYRTWLHSLFSDHELATVTEGEIIAWATASGANNTIRNRLSLLRTFFAWTYKTGRRNDNPADDLARLNKQYPRTYGKVQDAHPARFLDAQEAKALLATCDNTPKGVRDALVIGFGLAGMRASEIRRLTWAAVDGAGRLTWTGKGNRIRTATLSPSMRKRLDAWRRTWTKGAGSRPKPSECIVCAMPQSGPWQTQRPMLWGEPIAHNPAIGRIVRSHAQAAALGHVAPHDLRRSAANILHNAMTAEGGHRYDLLDIQQVLGHSDPATTMRSYLAPIASAALNDRAARDLDF